MTKWLVGTGLRLWDDEKKVLELVKPNLNYYCFLKDESYLQPALKVPGVTGYERVSKRDLIRDVEVSLIKLKTNGPMPLRQLNDQFPVWESDVRATDDFLADTDRVPGMPWDQMPTVQIPEVFSGLDPYLVSKWFRSFETPVPRYEFAAIDIETRSAGNRLANPTESEVPVIAVSIKGSDGRGVCLLLDHGQEIGDLPADVPCRVVGSELELLTETFAFLKPYFMFLTYNGDEFDLPYLRNRALRLGFSEYEIPIRDGFSKAYFDDKLHLDLLRWFDNQSVQIYIYAAKYKDMDLDSVSKALLGRGKIQHEGIGRLTTAQLAKYCWNDADLTLSLATYDEQYTMMMMTYMSRLSGLFLEDVCRYKVGSWITNIIMREHRRKGALIPNRDEVAAVKGTGVTTAADIKGGKYKGAIVMEPVPGVHWNVGLYDFASLYPTIIETWNLGYATLNCLHEDCKANGRKVPDLGYWVCGKIRAIESNFIEVLRALRVRHYKPLSKKVKDNPAEKRRVKAIEGCLKVVMNASYGVFGSDKFAFYYPKISESIAWLGRYDITHALEYAISIGMKKLYGDTDSIFLEGTKEQGERLVRWAKETLGLDFEFADTFYWLILTDRKKNYMGLQESDGKIKVMGMTGKKRNTPAFIRGTFDRVKEVLVQVKTPEDLKARKKEIAVTIYSALIDLRENRIPIEAMAVTMALSKDLSEYKKGKPQHVRVAEMLGLEKAGSIVMFVKTLAGKKKKGIPLANAKPVQMVQRHELDLDSYEDLMRATFMQILESLNVPWPEKAKQAKLA